MMSAINVAFIASRPGSNASSNLLKNDANNDVNVDTDNDNDNDNDNDHNEHETRANGKEKEEQQTTELMLSSHISQDASIICLKSVTALPAPF
jgi:hypothetical protein